MDKTSIIGIILGIIAVAVGMVLKGVGAGALINPAALLIIFVGTAASVLIAFPASTIKKIPSYFKILLKEEEQDDIPVLIEKFSKMSVQARREGLLSLETEIEAWDDDFISSGLQLTVDGHSSEFIREVMLEKIYAMETRHEEGAAVFAQAGTYAPTLGVLGAVIGLIAALGNMNDMELLGEAIAAAFIATLLGIFSGYVLWHPFANKLRQKSKKEVQRKEIIVEGILSVVNGDSPAAVRDKLSSYLTAKEIAKMKQVTEDE